MLEQRIRIISEGLARSIDRRAFLRRTGSAVASGMAALALGSVLTNNPSKANAGALVPSPPSCSPPGPYCNVNGVATDGCRGGHCYQHKSGGTTYACQVYYTYYQQGCWTTYVSGGYWTCCDCQCGGGGTCGCAQFNPGGNPNPL
jgi:hypothetical protein